MQQPPRALSAFGAAPVVPYGIQLRNTSHRNSLQAARLNLHSHPRASHRCEVQAPDRATFPSAVPTAAPQSSRVVKVANWRELKHLLYCHYDRLVVLTCTSSASDKEELAPLLAPLAQQHPGWLLLEMHLDTASVEPPRTAELSCGDVLGAMEAISTSPTFLVMLGGRVLERQEGGSVQQLFVRLDQRCGAAPAAAAVPAQAAAVEVRQPQVGRQRRSAAARLPGVNGIVELRWADHPQGR